MGVVSPAIRKRSAPPDDVAFLYGTRAYVPDHVTQHPPAGPRLYPREVLQWDARMAWSCTPLRPGSCSITLSWNAFGDFASRGSPSSASSAATTSSAFARARSRRRRRRAEGFVPSLGGRDDRVLVDRRHVGQGLHPRGPPRAATGRGRGGEKERGVGGRHTAQPGPPAAARSLPGVPSGAPAGRAGVSPRGPSRWGGRGPAAAWTCRGGSRAARRRPRRSRCAHRGRG